MKRILLVFVCMLAFLSVSGFCCDNPVAPAKDYVISFDKIALRNGVTATIQCKVFVNNKSIKNGISIFSIHGAGHTAATWEKFARAVFAYPWIGKLVSNFIAIDLPGHGGSSLPNGMLFGAVNLDDCVNVVINTLDKLKAKKLRPSILIAHSLGTVVAQQLQQTLIDRGTSLKKAFNINNVILLAPIPPDGIPCQVFDTGAAGKLLGSFFNVTPELGAYIFIPEYAWPMVFFTNRSGAVAGGTPTVEEMVAKGYASPESFMFVVQVVGTLPFYNRPIIDKDIFGIKHGTILQVVCFENDGLILPDEGKNLFTHLTGKYNILSRYILIKGPDAIHDYHISNPEKLVEKIFGISKHLEKISPWVFGCKK